jgi:hypothetical protein
VSRSRQLIEAWFLAQAIGVCAWWLLLVVLPRSRTWFLPSSGIGSSFVAFALPDLVVLALGSAIVAWLVAREHRMAPTAAALVAGGALYAALYTVAWSRLVHAPILPVVLMTGAAILSIVCARHLVPAG